MSQSLKPVTIYTDGACICNLGPGDYETVILHDEHRRELSSDCRLTTDNRMEMMAAIIDIQAPKH